MGKISTYTTKTAPIDTDNAVIVDNDTTPASTKKVTLSALRTLLLKCSTIWDTAGLKIFNIASGRVTVGNGAVPIFPFDYFDSGCVWTADAAGSTLLASMTSGVVVINGVPLTVAAVTSRAFMASKDVYVDFKDNGDGTAVPVYYNNTTNAASPSFATTGGTIRNAIIVTGASSIAASTSINQGQEDRVLPIVSSVPYAVTDGLGNLICPRDPNRKILGYRQITSSFSGSAISITAITGLSVPVIIPANRKVKITLQIGKITENTANTIVIPRIYEGASLNALTTLKAGGRYTQVSGVTNYETGVRVEAEYTPSSTSLFYTAAYQVTGGTASLVADTNDVGPIFIRAELA